MQSDGLHIGFIECARDVHMQIEKLISSIFDQFNFQFGQQLREPLETLLVAIDPDEIHLRKSNLLLVIILNNGSWRSLMTFAANLFQVHDRTGHFSRTVNTTIATFVPTGNVT